MFYNIKDIYIITIKDVSTNRNPGNIKEYMIIINNNISKVCTHIIHVMFRDEVSR